MLSCCLCVLQRLRSCLSLACMLAGKSLPLAPSDTGISVHNPRCLCPVADLQWQRLPRHDRQHIRLDMRLQSRWQEGNESHVSLTPRLSHSVPALKWIAVWLTVIIWPVSQGVSLYGVAPLWGPDCLGGHRLFAQIVDNLSKDVLNMEASHKIQLWDKSIVISQFNGKLCSSCQLFQFLIYAQWKSWEKEWWEYHAHLSGRKKNRSGLVKRTMNREKEMERGWRGQAVGEPHQGLISLTLGWNSWSDTGFLSAIVHLDSAAKVDPVNQQLSVKYIFNGSNF